MDNKHEFYPNSVSRAQKDLYAQQAGEAAQDRFRHNPDWQDVADEALSGEIASILYLVWADDLAKAKEGILRIIERIAGIVAERVEEDERER